MSRVDLQGKRFGRWQVLAFADIRWKACYWQCVCDCGTLREVSGSTLRRGKSESCGCLAAELAAERKLIHGKSRPGENSEYSVWAGMKRRCLDPKNKNFKDYGGRGIRICGQWLDSQGFETFLRDMGPRPSPKHSLDRKEMNGDYTPKNCRWATAKEQTRNYRRNIFVSVNGENVCLKDACKLLGISYPMVFQRIKRRGWSTEQALSTPAGTWLSSTKRAESGIAVASMMEAA
jgi:hypothetical protein